MYHTEYENVFTSHVGFFHDKKSLIVAQLYNFLLLFYCLLQQENQEPSGHLCP